MKMKDKIIIIDFGSQYTQLIARRVRELGVYSEIFPYHQVPASDSTVKGYILSGSPFSVNDPKAPDYDVHDLIKNYPVLGICYGAQLLAKKFGGTVSKSIQREYGRAQLKRVYANALLLQQITAPSQVWMSHGDTIDSLPEEFELCASTDDVKVAAFQSKPSAFSHPIFALQFHPEVTHSTDGKTVLSNFLFEACRCSGSWTPAAFVAETIAQLKTKLGNEKVILGLSGGVDSSVAALLIHQAIGKNLYCVFVNNGLLRKNEFNEVLHSYKNLGLNVKGVDASKLFLNLLKDINDPEQKRKIIGNTFIDVFDQEAEKIQDAQWLAQGTIYPDVIESISVHGPSVTIKSHHNVGGLPEKLNLKIVEPLRSLFKDEVRKVGKELSLPENILNRHPFPGPGLAIRIIGPITPEKVAALQDADAIFIEGLKKHKLYDQVWQAGVILLPIQSVGVMGDERTYENVVALRAVSSHDGMTADWCHLPYTFLAEISNTIINQVKGINRVVYDISSKPPATIEWE